MTALNIPLDIPDIEIIDVKRHKNGDYHIYVKSTKKGIYCRNCGKFIDKSHGYDKEIILRHLSILDNRVFIHIKPIRYICHCKGKVTTTQRASWYTPKSPYTKAYEEHILRCLINSTVEDVSIKENIGYKSIIGVLGRNIAQEVDWSEIKKIGVLGIDEISLKKGHKDFVTIITSFLHEKIRILAVLEGRKKKTVEKFLREIPARLQQTVKFVCSDMYEGFVNAAKSVFGKDVKIVIDRFHVAKNYRACLDELRKQEMRELKKCIPEEDYKELKGAMWVIRKDEKDLTEKDKDLKNTLFIYSPKLQKGHELSNALTDIFDKDYTKSEGIIKLKEWINNVEKSGLKCFDSFIPTLEKWMDEISNYFEKRLSSGFVEGLNNKIKVIKRRCYGILNVKNLFQRIYLDIEGYRRFLWLQYAY